MKVKTDCRHFDGYRPCRHRRDCDGCPHHDVPSRRVLLVNLDALGDVVRTTALLGPLHRAHPGAHVTWITAPRAVPLLDHVEGVDRVLPLEPWVPPLLQTLRFDLALGVDKSLRGGALTMAARAADRRGFGLDRHGAIVPLNDEAREMYELGLDDRAKFVDNRKSEPQLLCEAMGWPFERDPYRIALSEAEGRLARRWRDAQGLDGRIVVGVNTGSSTAFPSKHLPADVQAAVIDSLSRRCPDAGLVLLGGPEDTERNTRIARAVGGPAPILSPTGEGLRRGLQMVEACDVVLTGDSLGMHMAIGLGKPVVAWFGPTAHQEIDLFGRGAWVLSDHPCRPCMRATCDVRPTCAREAPAARIVEQTARIVEALQRGEAWTNEELAGTWPQWPPRGT